MNTNNSLVAFYDDEEPRADSRKIAEHLGIEHESFLKMIKQYEEEVSKEFGLIRFEIGVKSGPQRGKLPQYALLTEDQSYVFLAYSQNTEQARRCKRLLVKAFAEARAKLIQPAPALSASVFDFHISFECHTVADVKRKKQMLDHIEKAYALHTGKRKPTTQPALKIVKPRDLAQIVYDSKLSPLENVYRAIRHIVIEKDEKPPTLREIGRYLYQIDKAVLKQTVEDGVRQGKLHEDKSGKSSRYSLI